MKIQQRNGSGSFCCLLACLVLFGAGCDAKLDVMEVVERGGIVYRIGSQTPFSGVVSGQGRNEDYRNFTFLFKKEYKKGVLHGRSYFYYPDGTIESIEPYHSGVLNGVVTQYYPNGKIKARIHFVDGLRGGEKGEMFWNIDGSRRNG